MMNRRSGNTIRFKDRSLPAYILSYLAKERGIPIVGEARSAYPNTQGWRVSEQVRQTLENNGITYDGAYLSARYLEDYELSWFSEFAGITDGAMNRFSHLMIPDDRVNNASRFFYGVRDPEFGEITYDQAFKELYERTDRYLDTFNRTKKAAV